MQLTNIARDVGEDARAGRLYLPLALAARGRRRSRRLARAPGATPALGGVVARLLREADALYARARARHRAGCRSPAGPAILAAALLYAEIGREVEAALRARLRSSIARAFGGARKLALWSQAPCAASPLLSRAAPLPPLDAATFLIEAVARASCRGRLRGRRRSPPCRSSCACSTCSNVWSAPNATASERDVWMNYSASSRWSFSFGLRHRSLRLAALVAARRRRKRLRDEQSQGRREAGSERLASSVRRCAAASGRAASAARADWRSDRATGSHASS